MEKPIHESSVSWNFVFLCGAAFVAGIVAPEFLERNFAFDHDITDAVTNFLFLFFLPSAITPPNRRTRRLFLWAFLVAVVASILTFAAHKLIHGNVS